MLERLVPLKRNTRNAWALEDVETACRNFGLNCEAPANGSHSIVSHPSIEGMLTVPAHRSIKPIYVMLLVEMIESLEHL